MIVTLTRVIKYGWQGFLRNGILSFSTVSIVILAAIVFEGLIIFNVVGKAAIGSIQEKIDISVYFKSITPEDTILNVKRSLETLDEVRDVVYISREEALKNFKEKHADEDAITQTLDELTENPLLGSLNVKAKDPHQYNAIAEYLKGSSLQSAIEKITYAQNQIVIEKLNALIDTMAKTGITLTVFLAFLAVTVTFTTIRLAIFSNSDQLGIMRLVGASNSFIRGPYIIEGIIYGSIAAIISFVIFIPVINFISPYIINFIPEANVKMYFQTSYLSLFLYQFLFCIGLGMLSSIIAVRKYLHI